jgi:hypothetical protein
MYPVPVNFSRTWLQSAYGKAKKYFDDRQPRDVGKPVILLQDHKYWH